LSVVPRLEDAPRFFNRTRSIPSVPRQLLADGRAYLIPLYYLLLSSDLGREAVAGSGSFRFADHLYRREPSGRWGFGRAIDRILMQFPSSCSFRSRYVHARDAIGEYLAGHRADDHLSILSVPCGIARELVEAARELRATDASTYGRTQWTGVDLDPEPLELTERLVAEHGLCRFDLLCRDAFGPQGLPSGQSLITSTGFGEFLSDDELTRFYGSCRAALQQGGWFVTSGMNRHPLSDYLLRALADVRVHYRGPEELMSVLKATGFVPIRVSSDRYGLQTLVVAKRP